MKGGSRSVSHRMVVAFFVLLYRTQPNNTVFWNQKTIPKLFRPPLFNTGHLRFDLPEICPGCPGNGIRSFVNRKPLKWGCFSPLLGPPPLFRKATVLLNAWLDTWDNNRNYWGQQTKTWYNKCPCTFNWCGMMITVFFNRNLTTLTYVKLKRGDIISGSSSFGDYVVAI